MKVFSRTRDTRVLRGAAVVLLALSCSDTLDHSSKAKVPTEADSSTVLGTTRRLTTRLVTLRTRESTLVTTPDHPFAKVGAGWTAAGELRVGDRIETLPAATGTPILAIEVREVPATPVYNLTIARTHAYFVGTDALLVHNVDCKPRAYNPSLATVWEREPVRYPRTSDAGWGLPIQRYLERQERARQLLDGQRERRLAEREKLAAENAGRWLLLPPLKWNRIVLNDHKSRYDDKRNSAYFTYAGLSDARKASVFLTDHGMDGRKPQSPTAIRRMLRKLGLTSPETPPPAEFPPTSKERRRAQKTAKNSPPGRPGEVGAAERDAKSFMQNSSANTFAVTVSFGKGPTTLSLIAVKKGDGSIVYLDLQSQPPAAYTALDTFIHAVDVIPTNVDWRYNRQLYAAARDSPIWPVFDVDRHPKRPPWRKP